jgi:uncharacterized protein YdeI (BOF family)
MKKMAAMTAIVALVSMPVLAAEQGGFTGPGRRKPARRLRKRRFYWPERERNDGGKRQIAA